MGLLQTGGSEERIFGVLLKSIEGVELGTGDFHSVIHRWMAAVNVELTTYPFPVPDGSLGQGLRDRNGMEYPPDNVEGWEKLF